MTILADGLVFECPFENEHSTCPFKPLRALKGKQKYDAMVSLSQEENQEMIRLHQVCKETHQSDFKRFFKFNTKK